MKSDLYEEKDKTIVLWGAGYYYSALNKYLKNMKPEYIYDQKWANQDIDCYDEIKVIKYDEIKKLNDCKIIICIYDIDVATELKNKLAEELKNVEIVLLRDLSPVGRKINNIEIINNSKDGVYVDHCGNRIEFANEKSLENIFVRFDGENALIKLGENVRIFNELFIECGNETVVDIGRETSFDKVTIFSTYADVLIGEDCMFSYDVYLRNHDSHFIFDKETGKRINYSKNIVIKNHVWIGQKSILLPGFSIGNDSIIGAGSISSSSFPENVIIAGNSAKIIRRGVVWNRCLTWINNFDHIDELGG